MIQPDGFSTWRINNNGTSDVLINNTIVIRPGDHFLMKLDSDTVFDSQLSIIFSTGTSLTNRAVVILIYNKEV